MSEFQHLSVEVDPDNRRWITLRAYEDMSPHTLPMLEELVTALRAATAHHALQNILISFEPPALAANAATETADALSPATSPQQLAAILALSQNAGQQLRSLSIRSLVILNTTLPSYAMPLALSATYCISRDDGAVRLAFKEVLFGLHPNMMSTQQAIQRMGITEAVHYLLTGAALEPQQAVQKQLLDACAPEPALKQLALDILAQQPPLKCSSLGQRLRTLTPLRKALSFELRDKVSRLGQETQRPAPHALLALWERYGTDHTAPTQTAYLNSLKKLGQSPQANGFTRIQNLRQRLLLRTKKRADNAIKHIHVVEFGEATFSIVHAALLSQHKVTFGAQDTKAAERALTQFNEHTRHRSGDSKPTGQPIPDYSGEQLQTADLILVSQALSLSDSRELFAELEEKTRPNTILAINSSLTPPQQIAAALLKPQRLIGMHICHTAPGAELIEIARTPDTPQDVIDRILALTHKLDKVALVLPGQAGLLVDRILTHYILQGIRLHQQGVPHTHIDDAGKNSGMPHGPLELADKLGLDYCLQLTEAMLKVHGNIEIPYSLQDKVSAGKLGIASGNGFYRYRNGNRLKIERARWDGSVTALQEKLAGQIYEEAAICLEDGLLEEPELIDVGIVLGTGFAPWEGGPLYQQKN